MFFNTFGYFPFAVKSSRKLNKISSFNYVNVTVLGTYFRLTFNNQANFLIIVIPMKFAWITFPNRPTFYSILNYYACTTGGSYKNFHEIVRMCFFYFTNKRNIYFRECVFLYCLLFFSFIIKKILIYG